MKVALQNTPTSIYMNNFEMMFGGVQKTERPKLPKYIGIKYIKYGKTYYFAQVKRKYVGASFDLEELEEKLSNYLSEQAT